MVISAIFLIIYQTIKVKNRHVRIFKKFYASNIDGKLTSIDPSAGIVYFKVDLNEEYGFSPVTSTLNQNNPFSDFADEGDTIKKTFNSDTLLLVKNGKIYKYTFKKF